MVVGEIVAADEDEEACTSSRRRPCPPPPPFDSEKVPPSLAPEIRRFLRVANQIQPHSPRVAYLCRFHAFEKAHAIDPKSTGRGVPQFKTALLHTLLQDEEASIMERRAKNDPRELKSFYYKMRLMNEHGIASVLVEVLKAFLSEVGPAVLAKDIEERSYQYVPFNILPMDSQAGQHAIMRLPEIKAAASAVCNVRGLPLPENFHSTGASFDLLDWLQYWFGFQNGNIANQRENLILMLANKHVRQNPKPASMSKLDDRAVDDLLMRTFENYIGWSKFLGRESNIWLPSLKQEAQQYKILYISLYLLIWGEASNVRLLPECLCYIFHHMAYELYGILSGAVSLITGKKFVPAYQGEKGSFLKNVVIPIYRVIYEEAQKNRNGIADHSLWRNYDDLNEYFWSTDCFKIGWPMRLDNDFFCTSSSQNEEKVSPAMERGASPCYWLGKTNFVEVRSFWHLFRSFDRIWTFLVLALQVLIIVAWHGPETPFELFNPIIFSDILSIFITNALLRLIQGTLDIVFMWRARFTMKFHAKLRFVMKLLVAALWMIILPVSYASSRKNSSCALEQREGNFVRFCFSSYVIISGIYMVSNGIATTLFFVPAVTNYIETSEWRLCKSLLWWAQPRLYVGRGMHECQESLLKYTIFWSLLLTSKILFSYYFQIAPLVEPTRQIMSANVRSYDWHELFPKVKSNAGAILAVWSPIILVYFMDTQIWYSIFCTVFGGVYGILHHLGEIRTMGMVKSRFQSLPSMFGALLASRKSQKESRNFGCFLQKRSSKDTEAETKDLAKFALVWNHIIGAFRSEDLISNREMDLMVMPLSTEMTPAHSRWPLFLLVSKFSTAINMTRKFVGEYSHLYRKIRKDNYMFCAIKESYILLKNVLNVLVVGTLEKRVVDAIYLEIDASIQNQTLLVDCNMQHLPVLQDKFTLLFEILFENKEAYRDTLIVLLQDIFEILTKDVMNHGHRILDVIDSFQLLRSKEDTALVSHPTQLFASDSSYCAIHFPITDDDIFRVQVKRLYLMFSVSEKATDIPSNLEARRRISFFATSLFMDMPMAPKVRNMLSFSVLTPYFTEEVKFSEDEIHSNQDGASILSYMQKIYPDEWKNFLERFNSNVSNEDVQYWASFRGQTLNRTVRGMMYYRKALKLQAFLDMANDQDVLERYDDIEQRTDKKSNQPSLSVQLDALVDMKFTYVISCQEFGSQKVSGDPHAQDIIDLMIRYPSLRVAYIEEKEEIGNGRPQKVYSSVLVKADKNLDQEIYRIELPGPPIIGEGKPENQNHAIIFTRGDALQTIDMNQDNYLEEAFKMRNLLQEFQRHGDHPPTILGLREHIFTGSVSSLAWFMSYQEASFVTIGQRFLANPLRVRFHYGHPDVFDRIFHLTRGGVSKASKTINLSEDMFAGFNSILRQGYITYNEYIQVGKGRDVGLNQISKFEAKIANGNSEQTLSRDIFRLARRFDFFRMLSLYFTTVGFHFNSLISIVGVYVFLYGQLYLVLSGLEKALIAEARMQNIKSLDTALASQSFLQLGLLTGLPMVMEFGLEKGFRTALTDFILMQLQLASVFFTFSLGTKSHYFGRTILHGGAKYRPTGRKFVVFHASFTENYQLYSRSHFVKGFELFFLLIVYNLYRRSFKNSVAYFLVTYTTWFMAATWLFAPFLFNPSGFGWRKIVEDWMDWHKWMKNHGGIGVQPEKSWESWWHEDLAHLRHSGWRSRIFEILLSLRFFIYQYGLVYHLKISQESKNIVVYALSWLVILAVFALVKGVDLGRQRLSKEHQLMFRLLKVMLFLGALACIFILSSICQLSAMDLVICSLAFIPTGWGLLLIAEVLRPYIEGYWIWDSVQVVAQTYDYGMGFLLFAPVAALAWIPVISSIQTRVLFNQAFSRQLQIQPILAGKAKNR